MCVFSTGLVVCLLREEKRLHSILGFASIISLLSSSCSSSS